MYFIMKPNEYNHLIYLIEKELDKCPQKKGECYLNDIISYVDYLIKKYARPHRNKKNRD